MNDNGNVNNVSLSCIVVFRSQQASVIIWLSIFLNVKRQVTSSDIHVLGTHGLAWKQVGDPSLYRVLERESERARERESAVEINGWTACLGSSFIPRKRRLFVINPHVKKTSWSSRQVQFTGCPTQIESSSKIWLWAYRYCLLLAWPKNRKRSHVQNPEQSVNLLTARHIDKS